MQPSLFLFPSDPFLRRIVHGLVFATLVSCSPPAPEIRELPPRAHFVALTHDFSEFRKWGSLRNDDRSAQGETHAAGAIRLYVNALPTPGAPAFPIGTIFVKDALDQPREADGSKKLFAMVKRGGNFNLNGAKNWEWFELVERPNGSVAIGWRGLGAPDGEGYGGDPLGTCNSCHQMAAPHDYVLSQTLRLKGP